jgi:hypothetical protein
LRPAWAALNAIGWPTNLILSRAMLPRLGCLCRLRNNLVAIDHEFAKIVDERRAKSPQRNIFVGLI